MERYDVDRDRWLELKTELNEGRYHSTACTLKDRYIYVFGGFKTTHFSKSNMTRVTKKIETMDNVSSHYIEKYDTNNDLEDENWAKMSKI
jgi:N-acetylneuraminic acid mutarotase